MTEPAQPTTELLGFAPVARGISRALVRLPAVAVLALIGIYQRTLSPALPVLTLGRCGCRFSPTCSCYAAEAVRTHGVIRGVGLAAIRLLKCSPLHSGGFDPVPPRRPLRVRTVHKVSASGRSWDPPQCARITSRLPAAKP